MTARTRDSAVLDVDGVDRGQIGSENSLALQQLRRRAAHRRNALVHLGSLLGQMYMERRLAHSRPGGDSSHRRHIDCANAVDRGSDPHVFANCKCIHSRHPRINIAV